MADLHIGRFAGVFDQAYRLDPHASDSNILRLRAYFVASFAHWSLAAGGDFLSAGVSFAVVPKLLYELLEFPQLGRNYHLIDPMIGAPGADYCTDPEFVRALFPSQCVHLHLQPLQDACPLALPSGLAFAHLDTGDTEAEVTALPYLLANLSRGGFLLIDDYGWARNPALYRAAAGSRSIMVLPTAQGVIMG